MVFVPHQKLNNKLSIMAVEFYGTYSIFPVVT
jgi:hypothetical protein